MKPATRERVTVRASRYIANPEAACRTAITAFNEAKMSFQS